MVVAIKGLGKTPGSEIGRARQGNMQLGLG